MFVEKRNGTLELVDFNKILSRIKYLIEGINPNKKVIGEKLSIDPMEIAKKVCGSLINNIKTNELDELAAETCAYRIGEHLDYGKLASRIVISNHHKNTLESFSQVTNNLYNSVDENLVIAPIVTDLYYNIVKKYADVLDAVVNESHDNDYKILDYFGCKTLIKSYLIRYVYRNEKGKIVNGQERYQHLLMRQAIAIYSGDSIDSFDLNRALECYRGLTEGLYTHATPTMLNAGKANAQLSSCFLLGMHDSINGMYECMRRASHISKGAGGIGIHISSIRSNGSKIRGTGGKSDGIAPLARVINNLAIHVNQGGARPGAVALYLEPWHADIFDFLLLKSPTGMERQRARDLFYALWVPDLFMVRVKNALNLRVSGSTEIIYWSLMCPDHCPNLNEVYGDEFDDLYQKYENEGKYVKRVDILKLWEAILTSQKETGTPYMCYKDNVNKKSAQKNIGIIKSSNLCAEIVEYSSPDEYGTCNLGSINLKKMIIETDAGLTFSHEKLYNTAYQLTINLNYVIDVNHYPVKETSKSNFKHRPIGMGVQGLADVFMILSMAYDSLEAKTLNKEIFETIYFAGLSASLSLAQERYNKLSKVDSYTIDKLSTYSQEYIYLKDQLQNLNISSLSTYEKKLYNENVIRFDILKREINDILITEKLPWYTEEYSYINKKYLGAYSTFEGSPAEQGILQYDMWNVTPSSRWDFATLKENIKIYGLRNSLLVAIMPTATTAHILGNVECIEPITSNLYSRQTLAGAFAVTNQYLQNELIKRGIWNEQVKDKILRERGSVQNIPEIPTELKPIFKTVWEISKKTYIEMSADRGAYVDQSQSLNIFCDNPTSSVLQSIHMYGWNKGLKTGMYYLRTKPPVHAQQFTLSHDMPKPLTVEEPNRGSSNKEDITERQNSSEIDPSKVEGAKEATEEVEVLVCRRNDPTCTSCSA